LSACLKNVALAILADGESWLPARRKGVATEKATVKSERFALRTFFPDGKMPASTAGRDARRHIFRQAFGAAIARKKVSRIFASICSHEQRR
jgi:hypothetical protein